MDNRPYKSDDVEYVEAEPIEPDGQPAPRRPEPYQQNPFTNQVVYTNANCLPCCGPLGCLSLIMLTLLMFTDIDVRPILMAISIFVIISFVARILSPRRPF